MVPDIEEAAWGGGSILEACKGHDVEGLSICAFVLVRLAGGEDILVVESEWVLKRTQKTDKIRPE